MAKTSSSNNRVLIMDKVKSFFTRLPLPFTAFQISSRYISGIHVTSKDKKLKSHFVFPLETGVITPSFYKKNIHNNDLLEKRLKEGTARLNASGHNAAFLLPELSQRVFVFSFDALPASPEEREHLIHFRVKKEMPLLPEDSRFAFIRLPSKQGAKMVVSVTRTAVIDEYETFFGQNRFKVKMVGIPSLSLCNLLDWEKERDFALLDIEEDSFSLTGVVNTEIALYRQKPLMVESLEAGALEQKIENIIQEVENTANFIEDKEKRKIASYWVRLGMVDRGEELYKNLNDRLELPLRRIENSLSLNIATEDKKMISPLIGQYR